MAARLAAKRLPLDARRAQCCVTRVRGSTLLKIIQLLQALQACMCLQGCRPNSNALQSPDECSFAAHMQLPHACERTWGAQGPAQLSCTAIKRCS